MFPQAVEWGINPSFDAPYSRAIVFADGMERARELDPAGTNVFNDCELPPGDWTLRWDGNGLAWLNRQERAAATYTIAPGDRHPLTVAWTGDVRNLHVWLPGAEGRTFWPPFVDFMRFLNPVALRTLDWTLPNVPPEARDGRVVSPELQANLANRIGCGLHYTVPVGLTDAELVELFEELDACGYEITLEVGNENWNPGLWSWRWLDAQPGRVVEATAAEIARVFAIAERELPRARHYVGGQTANPWFLRTVLQLLPVSVRVDAAGCAAYVGPRDVPATADACIVACLQRVEGIRPDIREHARIARTRGARFELYEAGQQFTKGGPVVAEAQRSRGMAEVYRALAEMLEEEGCARAYFYSLCTRQDLPSPAPFGVFQSMSAADLMAKSRAVIELMRAGR